MKKGAARRRRAGSRRRSTIRANERRGRAGPATDQSVASKLGALPSGAVRTALSPAGFLAARGLFFLVGLLPLGDRAGLVVVHLVVHAGADFSTASLLA